MWKGGIESPLALTGGLCLFLALYAGLFVMLTLADFLQDAAAGTLPLEPFERTFQGLILTDTNLRHFYPSSRSNKRLIGSRTRMSAQPYCYYTASFRRRQSFFRFQDIFSASWVPPRIWKCRWGTDWQASGPQLETTRYPFFRFSAGSFTVECLRNCRKALWGFIFSAKFLQLYCCVVLCDFTICGIIVLYYIRRCCV